MAVKGQLKIRLYSKQKKQGLKQQYEFNKVHRKIWQHAQRFLGSQQTYDEILQISRTGVYRCSS
jgi:predicted glycosyl hydrolase (DUF1957 family)